MGTKTSHFTLVFLFLFSSSTVLDQLPFMMMSHPLIPASLAPASVSMAMGQMNRLSTLASIANVAQLHANPPARAPTSVIKVNPGAHRHNNSLNKAVLVVTFHLFVGGFVRREYRTPPPLHPHWTKLRCHPITAAACQVHRCPQSAPQTPHVRTSPV